VGGGRGVGLRGDRDPDERSDARARRDGRRDDGEEMSSLHDPPQVEARGAPADLDVRMA
jgi:hypothetical protein